MFLIWEELMPRLVGFSRFSALLEEQISEKISRRILSGASGLASMSCRAAHADEQTVWMLKGKMEFRLGSEQRVCSPSAFPVIREKSQFCAQDDSLSLSLRS
jgi:hypothetical protein